MAFVSTIQSELNHDHHIYMTEEEVHIVCAGLAAHMNDIEGVEGEIGVHQTKIAMRLSLRLGEVLIYLQNPSP